MEQERAAKTKTWTKGPIIWSVLTPVFDSIPAELIPHVGPLFINDHTQGSLCDTRGEKNATTIQNVSNVICTLLFW